jgi:predicted phage tail protein
MYCSYSESSCTCTTCSKIEDALYIFKKKKKKEVVSSMRGRHRARHTQQNHVFNHTQQHEQSVRAVVIETVERRTGATQQHLFRTTQLAAWLG